MEVVPLVVPVGALTCSESTSDELGLAMEISEVLNISLSEVRAQYFRDSDTSSEVEWVLGEERYLLQEELQERERFNEHVQRDREDELRSYHKDSTF
jgi:hypothetical protein